MKFIKFFAVIIISSITCLPAYSQEPNKVQTKSTPATGDLKVIMNGLLDDTKLLTEGIFLEDFAQIEQAANNIANHPMIKMESKKKILATLGEEMSLFKGFDAKVHNASLEIAKSATNKDLVSVVSIYYQMIDGCFSCHNKYKNKISKLLQDNN